MDPLTILLADDHAIIRRGVRSILSTHSGWKVCAEAENGPEAVAAAREHRPDIVVMDINMPGLSGLDAAKQIIEFSPLTKVLILSAHDTEDYVRRMLASGAHGYVLKSDIQDDLIAGVEALARGELYFTSAVSGHLNPPGRELSRMERVNLTVREREVLHLLAEGKSNKEIAGAIGLSVRTVECHRGNLMNKLEMRSLADLVRYAIQNEIAESRNRPAPI